MEKDLSESYGFKKLARDHHIRSVMKKNMKQTEDKSARSPKTTARDKIPRSASVNIPKTSFHQSDAAGAAKSSTNKESGGSGVNRTPRKVPKPLKSPVKVSIGRAGREKKFDLPKKSTSEEKSPFTMGSHALIKNHAIAGDGNKRSFKSVDWSAARNKIKQKDEVGKFKFVNEDKETTELLLQKKYLKSVVLQADLSDVDLDELVARKGTMTKSPRSILTKCANNTLGELKTRSSEKAVKSRTAKSSKGKALDTANLSSRKLVVGDDRSDDSDESGMSFLMKRYLEASDEVAKKFTECERLARSTKNSSTQAYVTAKSERRPTKKTQKTAPLLERPITRNAPNTTNIFSKLKSLKKN